MKITDVRVRKMTREGKMRAIVSITIDDEFVIHDIKVIEGTKDCSLRCRVRKRPTENTETLRIQSTHPPGNGSRVSFWSVIIRLCQSRMRNNESKGAAMRQSLFMCGSFWLLRRVCVSDMMIMLLKGF